MQRVGSNDYHKLITQNNHPEQPEFLNMTPQWWDPLILIPRISTNTHLSTLPAWDPLMLIHGISSSALFHIQLCSFADISGMSQWLFTVVQKFQLQSLHYLYGHLHILNRLNSRGKYHWSLDSPTGRNIWSLPWEFLTCNKNANFQ